jgi:phosphatidylglycerophosphatase C
MTFELDASALSVRLDEIVVSLKRPGLLAFDADGTLWQGDVTRDLVSYIMSERPLLPESASALSALAERYDVPVATDPHEQLAGLALAYSAGRLPEIHAVESVVLAFSGHDETTFTDCCVEAIARANLRARFHPVAARIFDWAAHRAVPVVVVSASPRAAVECALSVVGLTASAVLGVEPKIGAGKLLPELASPVLVGDAKVAALRAHSDNPVIAAFGDDVRDLPLLSSGSLAVGIHPTAELLARSKDLSSFGVLPAT